MIKIAVSGNDVYCRLTKAEFEGLSRQTLASVSDGTTVNLQWLKDIINMGGQSQALLADAKQKSDALSAALDLILNP